MWIITINVKACMIGFRLGLFKDNNSMDCEC